MKHEQVPTARVRGVLPPLGPTRSDIRIVDDELAIEAVLSWEKRPKSRGAIRPTR